MGALASNRCEAKQGEVALQYLGAITSELLGALWHSVYDFFEVKGEAYMFVFRIKVRKSQFFSEFFPVFAKFFTDEAVTSKELETFRCK